MTVPGGMVGIIWKRLYFRFCDARSRKKVWLDHRDPSPSNVKMSCIDTHPDTATGHKKTISLVFYGSAIHRFFLITMSRNLLVVVLALLCAAVQVITKKIKKNDSKMIKITQCSTTSSKTSYSLSCSIDSSFVCYSYLRIGFHGS